MKLLYTWLQEFVPLAADPADIRTRLSLSGTAVDAIDDSPAGAVLDAEVTNNRPDCLGHYGIARELAAIYRLPLAAIKPRLKEAAEKATGAAIVDIQCPELCGRYTARVLRGIKVGPSPDWLRQRLEAIGHSSINNVVDVTNYVMFELGQPMHAFDFDRLGEHRIVVRNAHPGEKTHTLDGIQRTLTKDVCVIADGMHPIAVGGIMGGAESEISPATRNVLLESAWFDPTAIRRAAKALGLHTEASLRFERGCDPEMAELASQRAAALIQQIAGGQVLAGVVDVYPRRSGTAHKIEFTRKELLRIMGADIPDREIEDILSALGFSPLRVDVNRGSSGSLVAAWECRKPSWRADVTREIDLIEEVARLYGFANFPARLPPARQPARRLPHALADDALRQRLVALGYQEIIAIPFVDEPTDALFRPLHTAPARIGNPLSEEASVLRSSGFVSMVRTLERNLNRGQRNLRLFEIGKKYELRDGQALETPILTLGASGLAAQKTIYQDAREFAFPDLKGDVDSLGALAGGFLWSEANVPGLSSSRSADIRIRKNDNGAPPTAVAGQVNREIADKLKVRQDVYVAELLLEHLYAATQQARNSLHYVPIPRFPAVERDFSLLLPEAATFGQVREVIASLSISELAGMEAVDLFRGGQIPPGQYSLLVRVRFQSAQTTLTDEQVNDFSSNIVSALAAKLGAQLRAS